MVPFCRNSRVLKNAFIFLSVFQQLSYLRDNSRMSSTNLDNYFESSRQRSSFKFTRCVLPSDGIFG